MTGTGSRAGAGRNAAPVQVVRLKDLEIERELIAIRRAGGHPHEQARRFWAWLPSAA